MRHLTGVVACASCAAVSSAGLVESPFGGDAEFLALTDNGSLERAVAEGRIGNAQGNGTWETALWEQGGVGTPEAQGQLMITNGTAVEFSLVYDGVDTVTYTVGGTMISWDAVAGTFSDIFIRTRSTADAMVSLTGMTLDGDDGALALTDINTSGAVPAEYVRVSNMGSDFGAFELTGVQTLSWTGAMPANSQLAYQIKLTNVVPAPGAALAFAGLGLGVRRRR